MVLLGKRNDRRSRNDRLLQSPPLQGEGWVGMVLLVIVMREQKRRSSAEERQPALKPSPSRGGLGGDGVD